MIFEQGDIVLVNFDPTVGHEPKSKRPALVVSNYEFNRATSMTIVCPITRVENAFFLHEPLPPTSLTEGFVVMEQVRALDLEKRGAEKIECLSKNDLRPILICLSSFFSSDGKSSLY
jgi:mRNA interferase MazF